MKRWCFEANLDVYQYTNNNAKLKCSVYIIILIVLMATPMRSPNSGRKVLNWAVITIASCSSPTAALALRVGIE